MFKFIEIFLILLLTSISVHATIIEDWNTTTSSPGFATKAGIQYVLHNGKPYLIGSTDSADVYTTDNGLDWSAVTLNAAFGTRSGFVALSHAGKLWVIGGEQVGGTVEADVWYSTNGADWVAATKNAEFGTMKKFQGGISYNKKIYLIGGLTDADAYTDQVYSSDNGVVWTLVSDSTDLGDTAAGGVLEYKDAFYSYGGNDGTSATDSVYKSIDAGVTWSAITTTATGQAREQFGFINWQNKLWIFGGLDDTTALKDSWYSTDGITWTQDKDLTVELYSMATGTFRDRVILIDGLLSGATGSTAVYLSQIPKQNHYAGMDVLYNAEFTITDAFGTTILPNTWGSALTGDATLRTGPLNATEVTLAIGPRNITITVTDVDGATVNCSSIFGTVAVTLFKKKSFFPW